MHTVGDVAHMRRALELARGGRGRAHPNPLVGAVLVREDIIVGEGFHAEYGGPHAEVAALRAAGDAARGATLYVTLEPCAHHGKTPPCTDAIIAAGVARVVYAAADPDGLAAGGGDVLRAAGLDVAAGVERDAARSLNRPFFVHHEEGRAYCALKLALSVDGAIAAAPGRRTRITGDEAMTETHRLRADHDAVVIGRHTAAVDDPLLTVRGVPCRVPPIRVVLDSEASLTPAAQLLLTSAEAPVWIVVAEGATDARCRDLEAAGARVLRAVRGPAGLVPASVIRTLGDAGVRSLLLEGGSRVAASFLDARCVDRLHLFFAPRLLGRGAVPGLLTGQPGEWRYAAVERFGTDVLLTLDPADSPQEH